MERLTAVKKGITPLDQRAMEAARLRQDELTKPQKSLGKLEELAIQMAGITHEVTPEIGRRVSILFAADHGVTEEGISAYPQEVTLQMVQNFVQGGAGINVLAQQAGALILLLDIGMAADLPLTGVRQEKIKYGTDNIVEGPAMTRDEALASLEVGIKVVEELKEEKVSIIGLGEMGIGNTTASSAVLAAFSKRPLPQLVGQGAGITKEELPHKIQVVEQALAKNRPDASDPVDVLAKVGGLEIGGMAGVFLAAARWRIPVIIDGFISGVAALLAFQIHPLVKEYMIPSHVSQEPGHAATMELLGLKPTLNLNMRLGEGTGAALMMHVVDAACRIQKGMATFAEAQVSGKKESL